MYVLATLYKVTGRLPLADLAGRHTHSASWHSWLMREPGGLAGSSRTVDKFLYMVMERRQACCFRI